MSVLSPLRADLYPAPAIPINVTIPDGSEATWQPSVVTLITGKSSGVLVDTLVTEDQAKSLGDWIEETLAGKSLETIYITHGHGDHWFNLHYLIDRFPNVEVFSTQESVDHMATQLEPEWRTLWDELFPGQISDDAYQILAKPLPADNMFELEGHKLEAVNVGHSDTANTTFLYVPDLDLAVAGDIVYNDVHMWMRETNDPEEWDDWLHALDDLEAFDPSIVIAAHHRPGGVDGVFNIAASKDYVSTYSRLAQESNSAEELYYKVIDAYPNRIGHGVLWLGCQGQFEE